MRVSDIQTYKYNQSFNALRLKRGSTEYLKTMPENVLSKLDNVKDRLSDTKYYHLEICKDCFYINEKEEENFYQPFLIHNAGKILLIKARQGLSQVTKKLRYATAEEVKVICDKIKNTQTQLERTAEIVKVLEDYEKRIKL